MNACWCCFPTPSIAFTMFKEASAPALQGPPEQGCSKRADCAKPQGHPGKCAKTIRKGRAKAAPAADSNDSAEHSALSFTSQEAGSMLGGPEHAPDNSGRVPVRRKAALRVKSLAEVDTSAAETDQDDSDDIPLALRMKAAEAVDSQTQPKPTAKRANQAKSKQTAKRPNQGQPQLPAKRVKKSTKASDSESYSPETEPHAAEPAKKKVRTLLQSMLPTNHPSKLCRTVFTRRAPQGCVWHACGSLANTGIAAPALIHTT